MDKTIRDGHGFENFSILHLQNLSGKRSKKEALLVGLLKQARKSSEDAQAAGYARFEKVWAG